MVHGWLKFGNRKRKLFGYLQFASVMFTVYWLIKRPTRYPP